MPPELLSIDDAGLALGVSRSTVWRLIRRGELPSVRRAGRRLVPVTAVQSRTTGRRAKSIPEFTEDHPLFRLIGAGRGGGRAPGARDKHAVLDE